MMEAQTPCSNGHWRCVTASPHALLSTICPLLISSPPNSNWSPPLTARSSPVVPLLKPVLLIFQARYYGAIDSCQCSLRRIVNTMLIMLGLLGCRYFKTSPEGQGKLVLRFLCKN
uniref:Uncharacterized protein n=1 Tax=Cacopsylla melanoneura TaxID=428564 RepID=A0A8D8RFH1_9HEMI